jgi:adenine-specific DNA-methyltransferase
MLMRRIVRCFSKPGDLFIDPFNGSGSTGAAAILEKRDYIGVELSEKFYNESLIRLQSL